MEGFEFFDVIAVGAGNIDDTDKFGTAPGADVDDELIEIFHDEIKSHPRPALFLLYLILAFCKTPGQIGTDFFWGQGTKSIPDRQNELGTITGK